jgi:hypothetical protein
LGVIGETFATELALRPVMGRDCNRPASGCCDLTEAGMRVRVMCNAVDRDYERVFVGDYQRSMMHFYGVGTEGPYKLFSYGYATPDGVYQQGVAHWDTVEGGFVEPASEWTPEQILAREG